MLHYTVNDITLFTCKKLDIYTHKDIDKDIPQVYFSYTFKDIYQTNHNFNMSYLIELSNHKNNVSKIHTYKYESKSFTKNEEVLELFVVV